MSVERRCGGERKKEMEMEIEVVVEIPLFALTAFSFFDFSFLFVLSFSLLGYSESESCVRAFAWHCMAYRSFFFFSRIYHHKQ